MVAAEDAVDFAQGLEGIGEILEGGGAVGGVERVWREGHAVNVAETEVDLDVGILGVLAGDIEQRLA